MGTRVYGSSDDLVEFDGDCYGEVGCYGTDDKDQGVLIVMSDGTILEAKYGKFGEGLWEIKLHIKGTLFDKITQVTAEEEDGSDVAYFKDGIKWAYAATDWELVK